MLDKNHKIVSFDSINMAFDEIQSMDGKSYDKLFKKFIKEQPIIASFLSYMEDEQDEDYFDEILENTLIIWFSFIKEVGKVPMVTMVTMETYEEESEKNTDKVFKLFKGKNDEETAKNFEKFSRQLSQAASEEDMVKLAAKYGDNFEKILEVFMGTALNFNQPELFNFLQQVTGATEDDMVNILDEGNDAFNQLMLFVNYFDLVVNSNFKLEVTPGGKLNQKVLVSDVASHGILVKVTLKHIKPPVWRKIMIPSNYSLFDLHLIIQYSFGWEDSHLWQFDIGQEQYSVKFDDDSDFDEFYELNKNAYDITLGDIVNNTKKFEYTYDFGDSWEHTVSIEKVLPFDKDAEYPKCLGGRRACPPEDCGGVPGYYNMLDILSDKKNPEYEEMMEWLGDEFDAEYFDLDEINQDLKDIF